MFNVIRIPTKFSKTIKRFTEKDKSELLGMLMDIGEGKKVNIPDTILGDTLILIYGEWMNMESKNGNKPESSLLILEPSPSMSVSRVEYSRVEYSRVEENIKENIKEKIIKNKYGEYENILLSQKEVQNFIQDYGKEIFEKYIKILDEGIQMKGYKYKDHNLAIRNWIRRDNEKNNEGKLTYEKEGEKDYLKGLFTN